MHIWAIGRHRHRKNHAASDLASAGQLGLQPYDSIGHRIIWTSKFDGVNPFGAVFAELIGCQSRIHRNWTWVCARRLGLSQTKNRAVLICFAIVKSRNISRIALELPGSLLESHLHIIGGRGPQIV